MSAAWQILMVRSDHFRFRLSDFRSKRVFRPSEKRGCQMYVDDRYRKTSAIHILTDNAFSKSVVRHMLSEWWCFLTGQFESRI